ncbi:MAG: DUF6599 family protein [Isosphaeraceae bacterium]|jgi:cell division protein FtsB
MMNVTGLWAKYSNELRDDPLLVLALTAALFALATTPIAFAILGRMEWFKARRGRVMQRPEFASIVVGMILVMAIPAIFSALVLKSRYFDKNRYEFDPNKTWSVLEQGRGLASVKEADAAVQREMERLALERKNLVDNVKKLDEAMLALRAVAGTSPAVAQTFPGVLQSLAGVRKSVGVDGPQQLLDFTAPPVELKNAAAGSPLPASVSTSAPTAGTGNGLAPAQVEAEIAAVPEPQKAIAAILPLSDLPSGWTPGKSGTKYIESFNAENLYEKIDGRAESFLQYGVKGMAYTFYHPTGDLSNELQLYVFEMADSLKALGKYGSEKPDEAKVIPVGDEGYTAAGSTLFYAGKYYTQIVSTQDDPKFAAFALELARRVAARQKPGGSPAAAPTPLAASQPALASAPVPTAESTAKAAAVQPAAASPTAGVTPATYFTFLPAAGKQGDNKYVAQDVFGYSFLSDVFMADYKEGDVSWQGFLRPYRDDKEAKEVLEKYVASVKQDGAEVKTLMAEGADQMIISSSIGLFDVVFRKGNTLAGANGATNLKPAEAFARSLAKTLPAKVQAISSGK